MAIARRSEWTLERRLEALLAMAYVQRDSVRYRGALCTECVCVCICSESETDKLKTQRHTNKLMACALFALMHAFCYGRSQSSTAAAAAAAAEMKSSGKICGA